MSHFYFCCGCGCCWKALFIRLRCALWGKKSNESNTHTHAHTHTRTHARTHTHTHTRTHTHKRREQQQIHLFRDSTFFVAANIRCSTKTQICSRNQPTASSWKEREKESKAVRSITLPAFFLAKSENASWVRKLDKANVDGILFVSCTGHLHNLRQNWLKQT